MFSKFTLTIENLEEYLVADNSYLLKKKIDKLIDSLGVNEAIKKILMVNILNDINHGKLNILLSKTMS